MIYNILLLRTKVAILFSKVSNVNKLVIIRKLVLFKKNMLNGRTDNNITCISAWTSSNDENFIYQVAHIGRRNKRVFLSNLIQKNIYSIA